MPTLNPGWGRRRRTPSPRGSCTTPRRTAWTHAGTDRASTEQLRALEGRSDTPYELRPNNTVEIVTYQREYEVYGSGRALDSAERHFEKSSDIALAVLTQSPDPRTRMASALSVLVLTMAAWEVEPAELADWLWRSWDRWWLSGSRPPDAPPISFDIEPSASLVNHVRGLWFRRRPTAAGADGDGAADLWMRSTRALRGSLRADPSVPPGGATSPLVPSAEPGPDGAGIDIPALLRCAHLYNNRIGVSGVDEGRLFATVTRALERIGEHGGSR